MSAWILHDGVQTGGWRLCMRMRGTGGWQLYIKTGAPRRPDIHICSAHKSEQADNADFLKDKR